MLGWHLNYRLVQALLAVGLLAVVLILTACECGTTPTNTYVPPTKLIPAYTLDIIYPAEGASVVDVARGGSVTLPVTVRSLVDEPIKILKITLIRSVI